MYIFIRSESIATQLTNKYSANASANGYEFEYAAALIIYLEHIIMVKFFGVEKKDDIYLELINGNKIYAQAKSSLEADAIASTHFDEIFESLRTLSENIKSSKSNHLIICIKTSKVTKFR